MLEKDNPFLWRTSWSVLRVIGPAHGTLLRILNLHSPTCPEFFVAWFCSSFEVPAEIHVQVVCHFLRQCLATSSFERSFSTSFQLAILMLSRQNGGVSTFDLILELCLLGQSIVVHTSLLRLLPVTYPAPLPPSSFTLRLTPTSHCASLTCPSKFSLSCFGPLSRSVNISSSSFRNRSSIILCTSWAAAVSSRQHYHLV